jgi:uncharacterized protein involved in exopolysaccharide biosynthesis
MGEHLARPRPEDWGSQGGAEQPLRPVRPTYAQLRPDLREALSVLWLRKWSIVAITLLTVGVALLVSSRQTPIYESQVKILVIPVIDAGTDSVQVPPLNLETEAQLIDTVAVAAIVAEELDIPGPPRQLLNSLSVDRPADTEILELGYRHPDPLQAQRRATAFADAYVEFRTETINKAILSSVENIEEQIASYTADFNEIIRELQGMSATDPNRDLLEGQATLLSSQIIPLRNELASLPDEEPTVGAIIQPAALPASPVSPNHVVNGVFGLIAGLGLGVALSFLRDRLSERLRSSEEAEAYLEAPILAAIPRVASWRRRKEPFLVTAVQWRSPAAEGYRVLRTNVLSAASALGVKSIAVTSAYAGEGKSATVANLAVVLARAG